MQRLKVALTIPVVLAATLLTLSVVYAVPFQLGDFLEGGGPGATFPGSVWHTERDGWACNPSLSGSLINDAQLATAAGTQSDAFDDALQFVVGGVAFSDTDDEGDFVADSGGQALTLGPEAMSGLQVTLEWKALASTATLRTFVTLRNTTGADIAVPISWETDLGSTSSTGVRGTSSGDFTFGADDRWLVTSDDPASPGDPVNTTVLFGPGSPDVTPSSVADLLTGCDDGEGVVAGYSVTVPAGQSRYLLFFNQMNQTNAEALAAATGFDTNPSLGTDFVSGIQAQLLEILNWDFQVAGPAGPAGPPASPSGSIPPAGRAGATPGTFPETGKRPSGDGTQLQGWVIVAAALTLGVACAYVLTAVHRRTP